MKNMIIGVDLDGVCADFYGRMREIAAEWFEEDIDLLPTDVSFELSEWGVRDQEDYRRLHRFAILERDLFTSCALLPGARKYLQKLSDEGARIRVVTHRLCIEYFHETTVAQTVRWLDLHGIPYWDLCFIKDKEQIGADVFIEDKPANVTLLRDHGYYTICFGNSTNAHIASPRVESWKEAYELIHERAGQLD